MKPSTWSNFYKIKRIYLNEGATIEDAALWRTLTQVNRIKAALSCANTCFTLVPEAIKTWKNQFPLQLVISHFITIIPFKLAIRSEIQVLATTSKATASNCAPCLSKMEGTCSMKQEIKAYPDLCLYSMSMQKELFHCYSNKLHRYPYRNNYLQEVLKFQIYK